MIGRRTSRGLVAAGALVLVSMPLACTPTVRVEHRVEPIHITMDINLRVDRELDSFFDFQKPPEAQPPATQPSSTANPM